MTTELTVHSRSFKESECPACASYKVLDPSPNFTPGQVRDVAERSYAVGVGAGIAHCAIYGSESVHYIATFCETHRPYLLKVLDFARQLIKDKFALDEQAELLSGFDDLETPFKGPVQ